MLYTIKFVVNAEIKCNIMTDIQVFVVLQLGYETVTKSFQSKFVYNAQKQHEMII